MLQSFQLSYWLFMDIYSRKSNQNNQHIGLIVIFNIYVIQYVRNTIFIDFSAKSQFQNFLFKKNLHSACPTQLYTTQYNLLSKGDHIAKLFLCFFLDEKIILYAKPKYLYLIINCYSEKVDSSSEQKNRSGEALVHQMKQQQNDAFAKLKEKIQFNLNKTVMMGWRPVPTHLATIIVFLGLFAIFIGLGIFMLGQTLGQLTYLTRYDTLCAVGDQQCEVVVQITQNMVAPVYLSYELDGFYQNMRGYSDSFSDDQLRGNIVPASQLGSCGPIQLNKNLYVKTSIGGYPLSPDQPAFPCGLIAYTIFNDSFKMKNGRLYVNQTNIAWPNDQNYLYKKPPNCSQICWLDPLNQHFVVWSQLAPSGRFRKIWGRIQQNMPAGNYTVIINNRYGVTPFNGKKWVVLSQASNIGGQNLFLPIAYLVAAGLSFCFSLYFTIKLCIRHFKKRR